MRDRDAAPSARGVGPALKIDVHTHVLPPDWPDLEKRYGYGGFVRIEHDGPGCARLMRGDALFRRVESNCWDPGRRIAECDRDGVSVQVLSTVPVMFSYWARPEHALELSRLLNDHVAGLCAARPDRFVGLGTVPLQDPDRAIGELERCVRALGLAGVEIGTHVDGRNLDAPELFPFFRAAQDLDAAVFVHPWDMMGGARLDRFWMKWLVGMPAETSAAICSLVLGGILERLPRLRLLFAHGGGAFPATLGRIDHAWRVRPDLCATETTLSPREQAPRLWLDTLVHDAETLRFLLRLLGPERLALGSDYPFPLGEARPGALIEAMPDLDAAARDRLLAGSALEWLGIRRERFLAPVSA